MTKKIERFVSFLFHSMKMKTVMKLTTVLLLSVSFQLSAGSLQQRAVAGRIVDNNGQALVGVNVVEKGTTNGAVSDVDGRFSLNVASASSVLVFSFIGYTSQEITVGSQAAINVTLVESAVGLDEIVVVGYGTQQRRAISGSVTNVTEKSFNSGITRTAADYIQGKVAGLTITTSTGDVTAEQSMRLRGTSSLTGSSEPFVVIDGVPGLSLNSVAPQDIESISILKDASAAAIYGSRSASGVILITTKKGTQDRTTVDYNVYGAVDIVSNKPDVLTAAEYRQWAEDNDVDISVFDKGANTSWFDEIMRTGLSQNHDLSVSGAGKSNSYRVSVSYLDQEGVMKDNYLKRINTRFSVNQKALKDHLDLTLSGGLNQRDYQETYTYNFVLAYNVVPTIPVYNADGSWWDSDEYDQGNPLRNIEYNMRPRKTGMFFVNGKATLKITKDLSAGINYYKERESRDYGIYYDSRTRAGRASNGTASREARTYDKSLFEATVNYARRFGKNDFNILGGYSYEDFHYQQAFAQNRYFVTNLFGFNNLAAGEQLLTGDVSSDANMYKLISFFGRINYSFADRYIISAALRRDGSSKFGPNNKWGTFPSVSAAWRIIDEPFMSSLTNVIDELKLRVGYGISGNQSGLNPYQSLSLYGSTGLYYDNGAWHSAYSVSQNPNPNLKWESTGQFNIGVDFSLFEARINGTIEYYNRKTKDLLYSYPVPSPPYMYTTMVANVGSMENKGLEITLNGDIIRKSNFRWTVSVNAAHNENQILKLSNDEFTTSVIKTGSAWVRGGSSNTTHIVQEGYQVGQFYGPRCLGIDDAGKYIIDDMVDGVAGFTVSDYTYIGKAQPKLTYGINNLLTYKNLELSFFFRGVMGNDVLNFSKMSYANLQWLPGANCLKVALDMGLKQSPFYNSYYIEKGDFLRLDNLTLGYSLLPKDLLGVSRIRVYATTHNLITFTKYKGVDPEVSMSGLDPGIEGREYYPKSRTYILGVNVTF
ncbi:MAG TPA: TonB-dependent receptor [Bacteroidales bacterium]|nr:TonB-dependent receptor [Bacteroidales bacterium]HPM88712.1 TonB-dependent receptor [Bacteroidales bacterium]HQM70197.1 TonB-dependent receptor [Bacteroidales bacterium]